MVHETARRGSSSCVVWQYSLDGDRQFVITPINNKCFLERKPPLMRTLMSAPRSTHYAYIVFSHEDRGTQHSVNYQRKTGAAKVCAIEPQRLKGLKKLVWGLVATDIFKSWLRKCKVRVDTCGNTSKDASRYYTYKCKALSEWDCRYFGQRLHAVNLPS